MDIDNKYYTPSIEEFHIGFEYEYKPLCSDKEWETKIIISSRNWWKQLIDFYEGYPDDSVADEVYRVKYLDKEDIESLGFIQEYIPNCFKDDDNIEEGFVLNINEDDRIFIHLYDNHRMTIGKQHCYNQFSGNWEFHYMFDGIIKNKSALKVLLKQLGIE